MPTLGVSLLSRLNDSGECARSVDHAHVVCRRLRLGAYLHVTAPKKQCGKSRLLEVLAAVVNRPWFTGRVTAAVLARKVDQDKPTLLPDEMDAAVGSGDEYAEMLRNILNVGFMRNGKVSICVGKGGDISYRDLTCFGLKALRVLARFQTRSPTVAS